MSEKVYIAKESTSQSILSRIGATGDTGSTTLMGKLNNMPTSLVKSIQYITYSFVRNSKSTSISISTVDPSKCIVIFERLQDKFEYLMCLEYTLNATTLTVSHDSYDISSYCAAKFGFWIVEFY